MSLPDRPLLGIAYANMAMLVYALHDSSIKSLSGSFPVLQAQFSRSLVIFAVGLSVLLLFRRDLLRPRRPGLIAFRGFSGLVGFSLYFMCLNHLSLIDTYALFLTGPLMIALLSGIILKEKVQPRGWLALVIGFVGVLVLLRPGFAAFSPWSLAALGAASIYALSMVATREMTRTDAPGTIVTWAALVGAGVLAPLQPVIWVMPSPWELALMIGLGVTALAAQYLTAQAYRHAPAGTVAPFDYTALLYIGLISWLVFDEPPDLFTFIGAGLLVVSGMIILREARRAKPAGA
jgi:S-adenosylmethionine uptake transporter